MKRGKGALGALLVLGGLSLAPAPAAAQIYPTCPPGYFFAPAYALCFPAGYGYDPGYFEGQGFYPYDPGFGFAPFAFFGGRFGGFHHFHHGFADRRFMGHAGHFGGHGRR
jgi:hypothetical protein